VGEGDIWIALLLGLFFADLGYLALAIFISYLIGSFISLYFLANKKKGLKSKIALGPFLVFGSLSNVFFGEKIISWYLSLL
jgi:leader peptidase (prepilin peptidase)/N-methyltransferase